MLGRVVIGNDGGSKSELNMEKIDQKPSMVQGCNGTLFMRREKDHAVVVGRRMCE